MERKDLTFRVFVSSTFSDMIAERNALQEHVFPKLRQLCQERGARFQAIDLRWGVAEEAALDQQTMNICIRELRRCQELSPRPNFIVLLGDRYGWRPLPPQVSADEFEEILGQLSATERRLLVTGQPVPTWRADQKTERTGWYRKDENAVPPEYALQPRRIELPADVSEENRQRIQAEEEADWRQLETRMRSTIVEAIDRLGWEKWNPGRPECGEPERGDPRRHKYERSATHHEISHGALGADHPEDHVFCYFREIDGLSCDESAEHFRDLCHGDVDADARNRLDALKVQLKSLLPLEHVHEYRATWSQDHPEYDLSVFCEHVRQDLEQIIKREVDAFERCPPIEREVEAHKEFAEDRCRHFVGRQDLLRRIADYLASDESKPLIVHGKSGSGKTALMAKAWLDVRDKIGAIARFIGATPGSCDLRTLLTNLCRQIGVSEVPSDMNELVKAFRDRLSPRGQDASGQDDRPPLVIFLDALDQLNPTDNARMLYWLPRELAANVKLVMSVLQTDHPQGQTPGRADAYDLAGRIWPRRLVEIGPLDQAAGAQLLNTWLSEVSRTLQADQRADVLTKFQTCPLPLYLKLSFEETRHWKSWEGLPCGCDTVPGLNDSVEGILEDLFYRLEEPRNHGPILTSRALGYIGAAKNGLTEDEMLDVLSADPDVMKHFHSQSPTELAKQEKDRITSLPVVIWSRLFADIEPYMTRRRADGTVVMDFYHRQVGEGVRRQYLTEEARIQAHLRLAEYFHEQKYWAESLDAQRARAKRLPPTPRPANVRKVVELPYHRLEVAKLAGKDDPKSPYWDAVADLLTDWQFLEAKAEADPNFREQELPADESSDAGEAKP